METVPLSQFPNLTLAQVHAALAYYHANQQEIEADIADEEEAAANWERRMTKGSTGR